MQQNQKSTLAEILTARKDNLRLVSIAIVAAIAVGILSSTLSNAFEEYDSALILGSLIVILLAIFILVGDLAKRLRFEDKIEATLCFNRRTGDLVNVSGYKFSREFCQTLEAVGAENRAIHSEWTSSALVRKNDELEETGKTEGLKEESRRKKSDRTSWVAVTKVAPDELEKNLIPQSTSLLTEVAEYISLELLSLHLSTYFNDKDEDELIQELNRKDIPAFLLENRVLNLLSTPIEQRDIFLDAFPKQGDRPKGEIYSLYGSNGAKYSRFDLVLPQGSTLERSDEGGFRIKTSRFFVEISNRYEGYSTTLPRGFTELMLGMDYEAIESKKIVLTVRGKVNLLSLFMSRGWEYYEWLDSFRREINHAFSFTDYCKQINWDIVEPIFRVGIPLYRKIEKSRQGDQP
ncbi:hypothetical protein BA950_00595 [Erythrobacter sp. SAORIC-644]|uniref:hypothetical protein n=1 Tax=Erythrobacter sp. SAORIC-644 TaxID=1869314 RepID=UPI000C9F188F|nr:hypothetical protein [Erythrobacter sp. SAORIC-644]PNQ77579.1 hypothetical protein BA950_00595 [Erythrobacter sp. SAORIC-644]